MKIVPIYLLAILVIVLSGCLLTNVPLSYSKKVTETRIYGYFQEKDDGLNGIYISKDSNGNPRLQSISFDSETNTFRYSDMLPGEIDIVSEDNSKHFKENIFFDLYFTRLYTRLNTFDLVNIKKSASRFFTAKYAMVTNNQLQFSKVSEDYIEKYRTKSDGGIFKFKSSSEFKDFITSHLSSKKLFERPNKYIRRSSLRDFKHPAAIKAEKDQIVLKKSSTYEVYEMRSRDYIAELKEWDDYSKWAPMEKGDVMAKFFKTGLQLSFGRQERMKSIYAAQFSFKRTVKSSSGKSVFNHYEGKLKAGDQTIGKADLYILNRTYGDLVEGKEDIRFDLQFTFYPTSSRTKEPPSDVNLRAKLIK